MRYRKFGKLDWEASVLGFGAMRLPLKDRDPANINESEAIRIIRYAIDHGVNYVDTAYSYHAGRSEQVVGQALKDGYRQRVKLATKMPCWLIDTPQAPDHYLNQQLGRLQEDRVDFYLLHGLTKRYWHKLRDLDVLRWAEGAMADGRIGHLGFSFHDDLAAFKEIIDAYDNWTLCQIQYNYMDVDYQAGTRGLEYAASKGLAVVIMEPLRGGRLAKRPPEHVAKLWTDASSKHTPAEAALLWLWDHPEVTVVLSGMSAIEQVTENVASADRSVPGILSKAELAVYDQVREAYQKLSPIPCTACGYCMPCGSGVEIPRVFELYNDAIIYEDPGTPRFHYRGMSLQGLKPEQRGDRCNECGECLKVCPQKIPIPEWLAKAHALLGPKK